MYSDVGLTTIVVPVRNNGERLPVLRQASSLDLFPACRYRFVVVTDGISDDALVAVRRWADQDGRVSVVSHSCSQGLGRTLLTGFHEALRSGAGCIVTMEDWHPGDLIPDLVHTVEEGADIAILSRFTPGGEQAGIHPSDHFIRTVLGLVFPLQGVSDYTLGFRAYDAGLIRRLLQRDTLTDLHPLAAHAEILLKAASLADRITELPVPPGHRFTASRSKSTGISGVLACMGLLARPKASCSLGRGLRILERADGD